MGPPDPHSDTPALTREMAGLAAMFFTSGVVHLVRPAVMEPMVPRSLPGPRQLIYVSGVAELVCAAGLLHPRTRRIAGWGSAAVLLAVLPANVQMAATAEKRARRDSADAMKLAVCVATIARLPLQVPLIRTALKAAGRLR
ncbi:DoxX family protein [Lapillicoccus sp.]|uniref:DoxX family protein n=1 Tax=Lapillicoccus sp. TaxID=1909287 RepID=UPI003983277D